MTWNIHQRNLTPHYYNAPEQQLNEGIVSSVKKFVKSLPLKSSSSGKVPSTWKRANRTPEQQQRRDRTASVAKSIKGQIKKRESDDSLRGREHAKDTHKMKSKLTSTSKKHGGQVGRVLSKVKDRITRSDTKMYDRDRKTRALIRDRKS